MTIHGSLIIVISSISLLRSIFLPEDFLITELIVTFNIIEYCSRDIVQIYSPKCGEKKGDKVVKNIFLVASAFFKNILGMEAKKKKKRQRKRIFILEVLDKKVLSYQEKNISAAC